MHWLNDLPFGDSRVVQIAVLAACGIAVLIALAIVYRVVFAHRLKVPGGRTRQPRLGLVDAFSLDGQRQLVLIRRDNIEHLVMIGGPNDVVIESQINRALAPVREAAQAPATQARKRTDSAEQPATVVQPGAPVPAPVAASSMSQTVASPSPAAPATQAAHVRTHPAPARPATTAGPVGAAPPPPPPASDVHASPVKAAEAHHPAPAQETVPRPAAPRPSMPPSISPQTPPAGRSAAASSHYTAVKSAVSQPAPNALEAVAKAVGVAPPSAASAPAPELRGASPAQSKPHLTLRSDVPVVKSDQYSAKVETPAARQESGSAPPKPAAFPSPISPSPNGKAESRPEPKADLAAQAPEPGSPKPAVAVETPLAEKTAQKNDEDPFAGLGSLEAEMARLLGRKP